VIDGLIAGNGGGVFVEGRGLHGFTASAEIVIPANSVVVFVKGDSRAGIM
jgi:1,4-alpha-glucan branching enzyme